MELVNRSTWLTSAGLGAAAFVLGGFERYGRGAEPEDEAARCTLSIGTYGMKERKLEEAVGVIAEIGFDALEVSVMPGFDGAPATMNAERRRAVAGQIAEWGLRLTSLMENLPPVADDAQHARDLARLRGVLELARDLGGERPPLVQTVLGGGEWEKNKSMYRDRVGDWLAAAREAEEVVCVKPHRGGGMSEPGEAAWLIGELGDSPWLRMVYDYSHYAFRDMPLEATIRQSLPITAHVVFKDAVEENGRVSFRLPGESGLYDYAAQLRLFHAGGYRGDFCCEVSSQVSSKPGYDSLAAARACYAALAPAFREAEVPRG